MLQKLIQTDKEGRQEDIDFGHFGHGHNIHVMIRRNFIYEDAFDKLSKANGEYILYKYSQLIIGLH